VLGRPETAQRGDRLGGRLFHAGCRQVAVRGEVTEEAAVNVVATPVATTRCSPTAGALADHHRAIAQLKPAVGRTLDVDRRRNTLPRLLIIRRRTITVLHPPTDATQVSERCSKSCTVTLVARLAVKPRPGALRSTLERCQRPSDTTTNRFRLSDSQQLVKNAVEIREDDHSPARNCTLQTVNERN